MRIGMQPPNSGPHATPASMAELAETADRLGYDSLQVTDHLVIPVEYRSPYPYHPSGRMAAGPDDSFFEPLSLVSFLAGRTSRIRLGISVMVAPYRNPVVTAKQLACMDVLSGGRMVLGLGVGWMAEEFAAVDARYFAARGPVTDEIIEIFRRIWRDQPASFQGKHYAFEPIGVMPKPHQAGGIPIIIGGISRAAIRRAARLGDGWQPFKLTPEELAPSYAYFTEQAKQHGRDPAGLTVSMRFGLRLSNGPVERKSAEEPWKVLVGTVDQVTADLEVYQKMGVTEAVFDFRTCRPEEMRETLELGAALIPRFAGR